MMRAAGFLLCAISAMVLCSCKKPYNPSIANAPASYLVVEGIINAGNDSTIIKLSRTTNVNSKNTLSPETGSKLQVESADGVIYLLSELQPGKYSVTNLNLDPSKKYRLSIKTVAGKQYYSDYESLLITPPIDSVTYTPAGNQLNINVNAHSPDKSINYYRYEYQETWEFHAKYFSTYIISGKAIVPRTINNLVYNCWGNHQSGVVLLGTTANLSQGLLSQFPLTYINSTDEKLGSRYSILVKQYALTKDAYTFWTQLKKNTENLGSIFDSFPSALQGNIHCTTTPSEAVIGYVGVSTIASQRIFITKSQLPPFWYPTYPYNCEVDTTSIKQSLSLINTPTVATIIDITPKGILSSTPECADCTVRGTSKRPSYWPN